MWKSEHGDVRLYLSLKNRNWQFRMCWIHPFFPLVYVFWFLVKKYFYSWPYQSILPLLLLTKVYFPYKTLIYLIPYFLHVWGRNNFTCPYVYSVYLSNTIYQADPLWYNITADISYDQSIYVALWGGPNYFRDLIFIQIVMNIFFWENATIYLRLALISWFFYFSSERCDYRSVLPCRELLVALT